MIEIQKKENTSNYKILHSKTIKNDNHNNKINIMSSNDETISPSSPKSHNGFRLRYDGRGNPILKSKKKKHHVLFCDQLEIPKKLIHVDTIESYKNYNAKNNYEDYFSDEDKKKNKCIDGRVSCCCTIY